MHCLGALEQDRFCLDIVGVGDAAIHRAHHGAPLVVGEADALDARIGIDHVNRPLLVLADAMVRTDVLACAAGDAIAGDYERHRRDPLSGVPKVVAHV